MASRLAGQVAAEIRAELARQRRSGSWLARQLGQSQSSFSRRLVGDLPLDLSELERIAAVLDVPLAQLLGWSRRVDDRPDRPGPPRTNRFAWNSSGSHCVAA